MQRIAVMLTCFNRREDTIRCLGRLFDQRDMDDYSFDVFLVDDGSSDGTSEAVNDRFPQVTVVQGTGQLFWNRGMHLAWTTALQSQHSFSFHMMLNDDTMLELDAVSRMIDLYGASEGDPVVVATTKSPTNGLANYGRFAQSSARVPLRTHLIDSASSETAVTMNGNCVLLSAMTVADVGIVDPTFSHRFGDVDLGFRIFKSGRELLTVADPVATCDDNPHNDAAAHSRSQSLPDWIRHTLSPKGIPIGDWKHYSKRHGGPVWPLWFTLGLTNGVLQWFRARLPGVRNGQDPSVS